MPRQAREESTIRVSGVVGAFTLAKARTSPSGSDEETTKVFGQPRLGGVWMEGRKASIDPSTYMLHYILREPLHRERAVAWSVSPARPHAVLVLRLLPSPDLLWNGALAGLRVYSCVTTRGEGGTPSAPPAPAPAAASLTADAPCAINTGVFRAKSLGLAGSGEKMVF